MSRPKTAPPDPKPALPAPRVQWHRCTGCGHHYQVLVEGTDLCMGCDRLTYPELVTA